MSIVAVVRDAEHRPVWAIRLARAPTEPLVEILSRGERLHRAIAPSCRRALPKITR
jgi:hypothetical protein